MSEGVIRWGILGTANIVRKNWLAILDSGNATVGAVASRDLERCQRLIAECQAQRPVNPAPSAYGSYEELLADASIAAVYVPLPTAVRKEWILKSARAGKHVLCEKPCALSLADLEEMTEACRRHGVLFMDGVMFSHSRRLSAVREILDDGTTVGAVRRIVCSFSVPIAEAQPGTTSA